MYVDPSGNLYESDQSADLDTNLDQWDQDEGSDKSRDDLAAFSALALEPGPAVFYGDRAMVDMPEFLTFMAGETIVGHFDGHMGGHNFFVYHEPTLDLWSYQPWSLDQTLARHVTPYEHEGFLADKCLHEPDCLVDYVLASQAALARFETIDFEAEVAAVIALTDAAMRSDPLKPYSTEASVESGRVRSLDYHDWAGRRARAPARLPGWQRRARRRRRRLRALLSGLRRGGSHDQPRRRGALRRDRQRLQRLRRRRPRVRVPIGRERGADLLPVPQPHQLVGGAGLLRGARPRARPLREPATQTAEVWAAAAAIDGGRWAIGLDDRGEENHYRWIDGSEPTFSLWANGEPSHQLDWFDCVFLREGRWYESNCIEKGSFVCTDAG